MCIRDRDRVDDALALHDLQTGFEHLPFRRVDHHRHAGDFGPVSYTHLDVYKRQLIDGPAAMRTFLNLMASEPEIARVPVMIDSSKWEVLQAGLEVTQGK